MTYATIYVGFSAVESIEVSVVANECAVVALLIDNFKSKLAPTRAKKVAP